MVVLIITSTWWRCEDSASMAARKVAQLLAARGVRVFCTCAHPIAEISADIIRDAESHNISAFVCGVPGVPGEPSSIEWICKYPDTYYKYLYQEKQHFGEISHIVAFAPVTAKTAFEVQSGLKRQYDIKPAVHLINHRCIQEESDEDTKIWDFMKDWVGPNGANTVWSLGPSVFDYYENWYCGLDSPMKAEHKLLLMSPGESELSFEPVANSAHCRLLSIAQEVSTYPSKPSVLNHDETVQQYREMAEALYKMKPLLPHSKVSKITWTISDSDGDMVTALKEEYKGVKVIHQKRLFYASPLKLRQQLKQSHFFVAPDTEYSFNMTAWLALGCGLPTLVTSDSSVGQTLLKLFGEHNDISFKHFLVEEEEQTSEAWKKKLTDLIRNMASTVATAQKLQTLIAQSHYIHQLEEDFVRAVCGDLRPAVADVSQSPLAQSVHRSSFTVSPTTPRPRSIALYPAAIVAPVEPIRELGSFPSYDTKDSSKTWLSDVCDYPGNNMVPISIVPTKIPGDYGTQGHVPSILTAHDVSSGTAMAISERPPQARPTPQAPSTPQAPPTSQAPSTPQAPPTSQATLTPQATPLPEQTGDESEAKTEDSWSKSEDMGEKVEVYTENTDLRQLLFRPPTDNHSKSASAQLNHDFKWLKDVLDSILARINESKKNFLLNPVHVAVLDSGICSRHPDLKGMVIENKCFVPELLGKVSQAEDLWIDQFNHGTMVAGILWQYAPFVKILNLKVLSDSGQGSLQNVVEALKYITTWEKRRKLKVDIINMSLGDRLENKNLDKLLADLALEKVIICAATNEGRLTENTIMNPANSGNTICVGSHGSKGERCVHSAVGQQLDFLCPGDQIQSTVSYSFAKAMAKMSKEKMNPPRYILSGGTSFAAPHASAIAAIVLALAQLELRICNAPIPEVSMPPTAKQIGDLKGCFWRKQLTCTKTMRQLLCKMGTGAHDRLRGHGILQPNKVLRDYHYFFTNLQEVLGLDH